MAYEGKSKMKEIQSVDDELIMIFANPSKSLVEDAFVITKWERPWAMLRNLDGMSMKDRIYLISRIRETARELFKLITGERCTITILTAGHAEPGAEGGKASFIGGNLRLLPGWLPIQSPPPNDTPVLLFSKHARYEFPYSIGTSFVVPGREGRVGEAFCFDPDAPTHWMPLPPPPEKEERRRNDAD